MKPLKTLIITLIILILLLLIYLKITLSSKIEIPKITTISDIDKDWINDIDDILQGARNEIENKTNYKSAYYSWGYPPKNEWVCTDVVWRALENAGINWANVK